LANNAVNTTSDVLGGISGLSKGISGLFDGSFTIYLAIIGGVILMIFIFKK
jgi:hypothetical protein